MASEDRWKIECNRAVHLNSEIRYNLIFPLNLRVNNSTQILI